MVLWVSFCRFVRWFQHVARWTAQGTAWTVITVRGTPVCVTYIPVYVTKPGPVNKTISDGQTTQRNSLIQNKLWIHGDSAGGERKSLDGHFNFTCALNVNSIPVYLSRARVKCSFQQHSRCLALERGSSPPPLLLLSFTCTTGMFTRWVLPCAVYIRLYKATGTGLLEPARKQVQWKVAIQVHERTFPSPRHLKTNIFKDVFVFWLINRSEKRIKNTRMKGMLGTLTIPTFTTQMGSLQQCSSFSALQSCLFKIKYLGFYKYAYVK